MSSFGCTGASSLGEAKDPYTLVDLDSNLEFGTE